jgi:hypothetical protein
MAGRRYNCACGKKRYRDEPAALAAASADEVAYGQVVTVYRCVGGAAWHLSAHGFVPGALKSVGRRLAYEVVDRGQVDLDEFVGGVGGRNHRRGVRAERCAAQMVDLGLVERAAAGGGERRWLCARDRAGLGRVVQIGLDAYAQERSG